MLASDLDYDLPDALIAQEPASERDGARMMVVGDELSHRFVREFCELVPSGSLLVLNDSLVMPARVFGRRPSGGKLELLFLHSVSAEQRALLPLASGDDAWEVLARSNRPLKAGQVIEIGAGGASAWILGDGDAGTKLVRLSAPARGLLEQHGHMPLPPYIRRADQIADRERYQTVFAEHWGSAAAPTAGLHLTRAALTRLTERGVELGFVTLHVGAGTFKPIACERVEEHPMHTEEYTISEPLAAQVAAVRNRKKPVVAVGTTVVRALESAATNDRQVRAGHAVTKLLITPGYRFRMVDALLTNFHAPRSTLLALLFAFAGTKVVQAAYAEALAKKYRFLSYGDAMWVPPRAKNE